MAHPRRHVSSVKTLRRSRNSEGQVGVMDEYCPHRRASLVYGRNEEGGLRCL
jgi:phenylpropionate dioxygenase-like ring-hydroxylating dioxygenase large terminal subunit